MTQRLLRWWPWIVPPLFIFAVYSHGLRSWFQQDDYAWMLNALDVRSWSDLPRLLFQPMAQGTIRPWSERGFFMLGYHLFGPDPRPLHAVVIATQISSLWMLASLTLRLTASRVAAGLAPIVWIINPGLATPICWLSTFNQILCVFFLLAALILFIRAAERETLAAWGSSFGIFLLGFGALEINIVFPALATAWCTIYARDKWKRTVPYWAASVVYYAIHTLVAAKPTAGPYAMHWNLEIGSTLVRYFGTALAGGRILPHWRLPAWAWEPPAWAAGIALLAAAGFLWRKGQRAAVFGILWFVVTVAPILPLRDHFSTYYLAGPALGIALAIAAVLTSGIRWPAAAAAGVLLVQIGFGYPITRSIERWHYDRGQKLRTVFLGLERAAQLHPNKMIILKGMSDEVFWAGFLDGPDRLIGLSNVLLAPGSEDSIKDWPELGNRDSYIASRAVAAREVLWGRAVVYQIEDHVLRNVTRSYARSIPEEWLNSLVSRLDLTSPTSAEFLGEGWHAPDNGSRWMKKRGTLRLAGPKPSQTSLRLAGYVPEVCVKDGPLQVIVTSGGAEIGRGTIGAQNLSFEFVFGTPAWVRGKQEVQIEIEVSRVYTEPGSGRELGLSFGLVEWAAR